MIVIKKFIFDNLEYDYSTYFIKQIYYVKFLNENFKFIGFQVFKGKFSSENNL